MRLGTLCIEEEQGGTYNEAVSGNWNIPNTLTASRIAMAPVLLVLAACGQHQAFLALFTCALLTDFFDGLIARRLHEGTVLGARLDSIADASIWAVCIISGLLLWPEKCREEQTWLTLAVAAFLLPGICGLLRFKKLASYHTLSAKCAMTSMGVAVLLWFADLAVWPFHLAVVVLLWAGVEQTLMICILKEAKTDVRLSCMPGGIAGRVGDRRSTSE